MVMWGINQYAQPVAIDARLDTTAILIGDQIHLTVVLQHPSEAQVKLPQPKDTLTAKVEIIESRTDTIASSPAGKIIRQQFLITSFDSGTYLIPPLPYVVTHKGKIDTVGTNPLWLTVYSIPVDSTTHLFDIKPLMRIPYTFREIMQYVIWILIVAGIIAGGFFLYLKYKRKEPLFVEHKIEEPPHVIALRELEALKEKKLWQQGQVKEYYSALTDILRTYLEKRYEISAMESTTYEIMQDLKKLGYENEPWYRELNDLLQRADLVKFAKAQPLPDENENSYQQAYRIVLDTKKEIIIIQQENEPENQSNNKES